jgi:hypothetical protein
VRDHGDGEEVHRGGGEGVVAGESECGSGRSTTAGVYSWAEFGWSGGRWRK